MFKNILLPVDGSRASLRANSERIVLTKALGAQVTTGAFHDELGARHISVIDLGLPRVLQSNAEFGCVA